MNPATGPHGTSRKRPAVTAEATTEETTEDRLRRELAQSSQAEARESLLREECARLRADNRALKRAEARRLAPPSAALYGPATRKALEGPLLTGRELAVASKERPRHLYPNDRYSLEVWLRNNGIDPTFEMRVLCSHLTVEALVKSSQRSKRTFQTRCDALPDPVNSHFRAALQKTVKMHHQRLRHYENVNEKLDLHQSHLDQRRRDLGYESEHG